MRARSYLTLSLVAVGIWIGSNHLSSPKSPSTRDEILTTHSSASPAKPARNPASSIASNAISPHSLAAWRAFQDRFGPGLEAQFLKNGRIAWIRNPNFEGKRAGAGYSSSDPQAAIRRARDILDAAKDLIGVEAGSPLEHPLAHAAADSAQVSFTETHDGFEISPGGSVRVDLGSQGELITLQSNYYAGISTVNDPTLTPEEAKSKALTASGLGSGAGSDTGEHLLWLTRIDDARTEARHAYEFVVKGQQIVVDASSGQFLYRRTRRQD